MRRLRVTALPVAVMAAAIVSVPPASAAKLFVSVTAPEYESPGGTVPVIVTAYNPPSGYVGTLTATASNGASATCAGGTWFNPVRNTLSRTCYVTLPTVTGRHYVTGHATFTRNGAATIRAAGRGGRAIQASGYVSRTPMSQATVREIERCFNTSSHVQLTFDDSASETQLRGLLQTLEANNVRGRFFFTGASAATNPSLLELIKHRGHWVANHTKSHRALSAISAARVRRQISGGVAATTAPRLLRPPFGAGAFTTRLWNIAGETSYRLCRWTTDTYDWEGANAAVLVERVRYGDYRSAPISAGGVILMHGHGRNTDAALQGIIDAVRAKGLSLEPLAP